jgi:predicted RNA-binding protein with PIN domain
MPYLIDGNNLIGASRRTSRPSREDRTALVSEIAERLRRTRARAILFFDGEGERSSELGALSIRASGTATADDAILGEIRRCRAPQECTVVTADRALIGQARDLGARTIAPDAFWARLGTGPVSTPSGIDRKVDVDEWLRYFEDEKNREG